MLVHLDGNVLPFDPDAGPQPPGHHALILAIGSEAVATLAKHKVIPKGRTITWCRYPRVFSLLNGAKVLVTYSPSIERVDYAKYVDFRWDVFLANRYVTTQSFDPEPGKYEYTEDLAVEKILVEELYEETGKPVEVALDLETLGLDPYREDAYIVSVQVTVVPGHTSVVPFVNQEAEQASMAKGTTLRGQIEWLMTSDKVSLRGANLKYDLHWLCQRSELKCTNFKFDTMLVGSLLDENRRNSLNTHAKWYLPHLGGYDDKFDGSHDKSRMDWALWEDPDGFLQYAGGDTDACLQVSKIMKEELLADKPLAKFYINILHPAVRAYETVERTGLLVDIDYYLDLEEEILQEMDQLHRIGLAMLPYKLVLKHYKTGNLNLNKASLLVDFLFSPQGLNLTPKMMTAKTGAPSTAADHLDQFANHPKAGPFIRILQQYSDCAKTLSTYVLKRDKSGKPISGFLFHVKHDRRFHPTHFLYNTGDHSGGTNTGRISVRDPAMQTLPKHTKWAKKLRRAFIAPPGYLVMSNDYSQGELKIAACLANEPTMLAAYKKGLDLHAITGAEMADMPFEEFLKLQESDESTYARIRQRAKAGNFGFLYGMGAAGFVIYAQSSYGVKVTENEALQAREAFFKTYPRLLDWHDEYKAFARQNGYVRSPLGRVRHLPMIKSPLQDIAAKAERQSVNAPVQSTLSDFSLWATALMDDYQDSQVVAMVHDQLVSYVKEDRWEECAKYTIDVMENLPFEKVGWEPQLRFTVDCEVGPNMAELEKISVD